MTARAAASELEAWLDRFIGDPGFLAAYPQYAAILAGLTPVADPSVVRMAVSLHHGRFFLHVNVDAFLHEPQYLRGVLLHEVHHIVLGHLTHPKFAEADDPELMDLALEMSANEYIVEPLPKPIHWRAYAAFGICAGQSTLERYQLLAQHAQASSARPRPAHGEDGASTVDDHRFLGRGDDAPGGVTQTALLIAGALAEPPGAEPEPAPNVDAAKLVAGRSPGQLIEELGDTLRAPERAMDWRSAMAMFVARARAPVHTWSRPSRRFPQRIFEVPGRSWAPRRIESPRLIVAIDTSLSMTRAELEEVARQLVLLSERAHLTIAECDVEVARVYPFAGKITDVVGRGGTDLRPVFDTGLLGAQQADGVIYFTDGLGPTPLEPPPVPTLWVLTKLLGFRCPWGERALMPRKPGPR